MIPPDYKGYIPVSGYNVFKQETYFGYTLMRPIIKDKSKETLKKAVDLVKKVKVYPFADADNPKPTRYIDLVGKDIDGIVKFDPGFYRNLHEILEQEYLEDKDLAMMGMLQAMGITKGLKKNKDGTVDLYMGPKAPKGKEGNWIPTAEGQKYYMLFRFYGADNAVFTKTWQLNDLELVK